MQLAQAERRRSAIGPRHSFGSTQIAAFVWVVLASAAGCGGKVVSDDDATLSQSGDGGATADAHADARATPACTPGTQECRGFQPFVCDSTGGWNQEADECAYACHNGACTQGCDPGAVQCHHSQPQACDTRGLWQNDGGPCGEGSTCYAGTCEATGSQEWTTPGTFTWTVPTGVTLVSAVAIGGGGLGASGAGSAGGGGGALCYANNLTVTPGSQVIVEIGAGATAKVCSFEPAPGGTSSFAETVIAGGGGTPQDQPGGAGGFGGTGTGGVCFSGGSGGRLGGGGGGAGGYAGNGGNGGDGIDGACVPGDDGAGGGGGGGGPNPIYTSGGGGGTGIMGQGNDGVGGATGCFGNPYQNGGGSGGGGSGGAAGASAISTDSTLGAAPTGGFPGGGSGAFPNGGVDDCGNAGADGAVRVIWGSGRSFPSNAM